MLEMAFAAFFVMVALVAIGGRSQAAAGPGSVGDVVIHGDGTDLPCPWCRAQTSEQDDHCPSCGQRFG